MSALIGLCVMGEPAATPASNERAPASKPSAITLPSTTLPPGTAKPGVAPERLVRLSRGVNVPHWMAMTSGTPDRAAREAYFGRADVRRLRAAGFTHVRVPIDPAMIWDEKAQRPTSEGAGEVRAAVEMILEAGLSVCVDVYPAPGQLAVDEKAGRAAMLERVWGLLASELKSTDPERVFFELCNEPNGIKDAQAWSKVQQELVRQVRAIAPTHTLILTGDQWGGIDGLVRTTPVSDRNVVYSFHFYEPMTFTHQGATWGSPTWKDLRGLPYPSSEAEVSEALKQITDPKAQSEAKWYAGAKIDRAKLAGRIDVAVNWARKHNVALYCGEFGVYAKEAPRQSRLNWITDVRSILNDRRIAWSMWDYSGGFALAKGEPGARSMDRQVLEALGLVSP
jgi:aryl-phospho-beta-D-glucosidase BglC (GH1 family)